MLFLWSVILFNLILYIISCLSLWTWAPWGWDTYRAQSSTLLIVGLQVFEWIPVQSYLSFLYLWQIGSVSITANESLCKRFIENCVCVCVYSSDHGLTALYLTPISCGCISAGGLLCTWLFSGNGPSRRPFLPVTSVSCLGHCYVFFTFVWGSNQRRKGSWSSSFSSRDSQASYPCAWGPSPLTSPGVVSSRVLCLPS